MTQGAERIKGELGSLSKADQAELALHLLNLPGPPQRDEDELDQTLNRRIEEIKSGRVKGIPAEELHRRMREKHA